MTLKDKTKSRVISFLCRPEGRFFVGNFKALRSAFISDLRYGMNINSKSFLRIEALVWIGIPSALLSIPVLPHHG